MRPKICKLIFIGSESPLWVLSGPEKISSWSIAVLKLLHGKVELNYNRKIQNGGISENEKINFLIKIESQYQSLSLCKISAQLDEKKLWIFVTYPFGFLIIFWPWRTKYQKMRSFKVSYYLSLPHFYRNWLLSSYGFPIFLFALNMMIFGRLLKKVGTIYKI